MDTSGFKVNFKLLIFAIIIVFILMGSLFFIIIKSRKQSILTSLAPKSNISPTSKPSAKAEMITSVGYSIDCQVTVTTTAKKIYLRKMTGCQTPLTYNISSDGQYLFYSGKYVYSLTNNADTVIDPPTVVTDDYFDKNNGLSFLSDQNLTYYFISELFRDYPSNFDTQTGIFDNLHKNKVIVSLPVFGSAYGKITENNEGIVLLDNRGTTLYSISFQNLSEQLSPSQNSGINRQKLNWAKRIFYVDNDIFKTVNLDGTDEIIHKFTCDGVETTPFTYDKLLSRPPDGTLLAFTGQIGKQTKLMIYDFIKDICQQTNITQTRIFQENFAFSPDGSYLVHADSGINLYILDKKSDYQLAVHNPQLHSGASAVTGPFVWSADSKFIYVAVSQMENNSATSTSIVRIYFNEFYRGTEENVLDIPFGSFYTVSPDGSKILYSKDKNIYSYDIPTENGSFFQSIGQTNINKIVWLRNGKVVTNKWDSSYYIVDFDGENYVYSTDNTIKIYDLNRDRDKTPAVRIKGQVLSLFY